MHQSRHSNWLLQHPFFSNLILLLFATLFAFSLAEIGLRFLGKIPGYVPRYSSQAFKPVNKLEVHQSFLTDGEGVFKANPNYGWPQEYQINSDGFRSIEFKQYETPRTKILFLGDSFAWGLSATPITNCFVDLIAKQGYVTFNTGIPGTDPNQYAYLAEKYVPLFKPDIVIVMFYMGNDLIPPRPMVPYKNLHHITNAGWLCAFDENGNHMSPQEAYEYYLVKCNAAYLENAGKTLNSTIRLVSMKLVIGTYSWVYLSRVKRRLMHLLNQNLTNPFSKNDDSHDASKEHGNHLAKNKREVLYRTRESLTRIKMISEKYGARFKLFLIPVHPGLNDKRNSIENNIHIFKGFRPYIPKFLTEDDYKNLPSPHLNNSGHRKYAEFILRSLESGSQ